MVTSQLPRSTAQEIINQYADVLRLGSLRVNKEVITWDASAQCTPSMRLAHFHSVLDVALRSIPGLQGLTDRARSEGIVYWVCKALSINYGLAEVLRLIACKVGAECSIESYSQGGCAHPVEYALSVEPGPSLRVSIFWGARGNLVSYDARTARKEVRGTVSRIETQFGLPPERGFLPEYHVELELCESRVIPRFLPFFTCSPQVDIHGDLSFERLCVATPLRKTLERAPPSKPKLSTREDTSCRVPSACLRELPADAIASSPCNSITSTSDTFQYSTFV